MVGRLFCWGRTDNDIKEGEVEKNLETEYGGEIWRQIWLKTYPQMVLILGGFLTIFASIFFFAIFGETDRPYGGKYGGKYGAGFP